MPISQHFLKVKSNFVETTELDADEPVSKARFHQCLIQGLRKEYTPFIFSLQGWTNQPTIIKLENFLANQKELARQMSGMSIFEGNDVLLSKKNEKNPSKTPLGDVKNSTTSSSREMNSNGHNRHKSITCQSYQE